MAHFLLLRSVQTRIAIALAALLLVAAVAWLLWPAPAVGASLQGRWKLEPVEVLGGMATIDPKRVGFSGEMTITENAVAMGPVAVRASFVAEGSVVRVKLADDLVSFAARIDEMGLLRVELPGAVLVYRRL
ncbi:MAG: hypothetical protein Q8M11_22320 [Sulfuritalea sp.]|nr:hypothetical protein [Sulfuritalea sp.]